MQLKLAGPDSAQPRKREKASTEISRMGMSLKLGGFVTMSCFLVSSRWLVVLAYWK